jgi:hypothetical protein
VDPKEFDFVSWRVAAEEAHVDTEDSAELDEDDSHDGDDSDYDNQDDENTFNSSSTLGVGATVNEPEEELE